MASRSSWKAAALASAVAGLFLAGAPGALAADDSHEGKVKCEGVNACKGQGACRGQGHVWLTAEECAAAKARLRSSR